MDNAVASQQSPDQSQATQTPSTEESPPQQKKSGKMIIILILIILLLLCLGAGVVGYIIYKRSQTKDEAEISEETENDEDGDEQVPTPKEEEIVESSRLFYTSYEAIYEYDFEEKALSKIIDRNSIRSIDYIDEETIGFAECNSVEGDFGCGLYTLNVDTKSVTEVYKGEKEDFIMEFDFYTKDQVAFAYETDAFRYISLFNSGALTEYEKIPVNVYGRGGFYADDSRVRFSEDGKYFLLIDTSSPKDSMDFSIYIFNVATKAMDTISNATHPNWIDNNEIVYAKYDGSNLGGMFTYDISSKVSTQVSEAGTNVILPYPSKKDSNILYVNQTDNDLWVIDADTKVKSKISDSADMGIWYTPDFVIYDKSVPCVELCIDSDHESAGAYLYDLKNNTDLGKMGADKLNIYGFASKYGRSWL